MPIFKTQSYFKNLYYRFLDGPILFLLTLKRSLSEKAFFCVKTKANTNSAVNLAEMLKEANIHFCLLDESQFPKNICTL